MAVLGQIFFEFFALFAVKAFDRKGLRKDRKVETITCPPGPVHLPNCRHPPPSKSQKVRENFWQERENLFLLQPSLGNSFSYYERAVIIAQK